ncbi:MAG: putative metal-dependent hydrolase, TIM-barrel fold [Chloroflexi bacterium]|jgi:predicted TIM-barrel fold metal-dependent hydrolase|nr:MAG: putative metal-dependent hydrolase, TIM-barrel fold [Chloroflexota bacterium]
MKNGFKAMDSDMHIMEPGDLWQRYIDPAYAERAPIGLTESTRDIRVRLEGQTLSKGTFSSHGRTDSGMTALLDQRLTELYSDSMARDFDGVSQLNAMDKEGLDVAVLFPTRGLFVLGIDQLDPGLAAAIATAYNDWLHDFCQADPTRMFGAAMLAPHDVDAAVLEARRSVEEYGFKSVYMRPTYVNGHTWSDSYYDPLWAECERLGVPVGFHAAGFVDLPQPVHREFTPTFSLQNTLTFPLENMTACADMIFGGVFQRFPSLKVAYLEGNCSWMPWLLWRMDEYMEVTGYLELPDLELMPNEYFKRQGFTAIECDEITATHLPEYGLEDNVVFSTDYPHLDVKYPHAVENLLELPISDQSKRKYLWDNCARLYGLD